MTMMAALIAHPWASATDSVPKTAVGLAVMLALLSAAATSVSASLQHHAASKAPSSHTGVFSVMRHLLRQRLWLTGIPISVSAMVLHTLALKHGSLTTVQPVMVTGVVLAVIVRAAFERRWIGATELFGVLLAAIGLGGFLVLSQSGIPGRYAGNQDALLPMGATVALIGVVLAYRRWGRPSPRMEAYVMATASGLCFGILDSLLKVMTDLFSTIGLGPGLVSWPVLAVCLCGAGGVMLNQRAYQVAPISVAMPVVNITNIVVAIGFTWYVYGQPPSTSRLGLGVQVAFLLLAAHGLRRIALATGHGDTHLSPAGLEETMMTTDAVALAAVSEVRKRDVSQPQVESTQVESTQVESTQCARAEGPLPSPLRRAG